MQINTGKGKITLMMLIALWSLSLGVNLPGLAVTPVLDTIKNMFPDVTPFKVTLLEALPNLLIIPFMLLAGKLSLTPHKMRIITVSLFIYLAAAILYMFCKSMNTLIAVSALLGVGCGLLIPFSTGLIADVFTGKYRVKQMGIASAISNIALVFASFLVGVLATARWNFPFLVYLVPIIPICLLPWLKQLPAQDFIDNAEPAHPDAAPVNQHVSKDAVQFHGFYINRLIQLLISYFVFVFVVQAPVIYISFLEPHITTTGLGFLTSCCYIGMSLMGIFLTKVIDIFKSRTIIVAWALVVIGCSIFLWDRSGAMLAVAFLLLGLGNGISQPVFYSKAARTCVEQSHSTLAMSFLLTANYLAVALCSSVMDILRHIFHTDSQLFPFIVVTVISVITMAVILWKRDTFAYNVNPANY